jgi:hypothetical protein
MVCVGDTNHVERNLIGMAHDLRAHDLSESLASLHSEVVAVRVNLLFAT